MYRALFIVAAILVCFISLDLRELEQNGEYYGLLIFATMGMSLMAAAHDLIMLYLAIETTSITLYLLAGFLRTRQRSAESGLKYFLFGAFTSTIMLYGFSLLYGFTGATGYEAVAAAMSKLDVEPSRWLVMAPLLLGDGGVWVQDCGGAVPLLVAGCLRRRAHAHHRVHLGGEQGGRLCRPGALLDDGLTRWRAANGWRCFRRCRS